MPVAVITKASDKMDLWGLRDVTQWLEARLWRHPTVLPWEQSSASSLTLKEILLTPFQRPLSAPSSITEEITIMFRRLEELKVRVPAPDDVWQYFEKYPHLIEMAKILSELASERFPDAILSLEISRDPDEDEEYVVLYARFRNYDETTMKRVRDVRKEFLSSLGEEGEWPLLTTDFRSP